MDKKRLAAFRKATTIILITPTLLTLPTAGSAFAKGVTWGAISKEVRVKGPIEMTITGKVTDENGQPLVGVSVLIKKTLLGTTTDTEGRYRLEIPTEHQNGSLVFSFVGYVTEEVKIGNQTVVNFQLLPDIQTMMEVVVTALGIPKDKKAVSYSVSEAKGEEFTQAREINLATALTGKIAGVNASGLASGPGGSSRVVIRGNGSLNGDNQPLYVVNGMPIDNTTLNTPMSGASSGLNSDRGDGIAGINPDDIESITVLKGGTAAALYGSRASNGVILITTKKGAQQKGVGVEYNGTYTFENPSVIPDWQYEYGAGKFNRKPANQAEATNFGRLSYGAKMDGTDVIQFDGVSRPYSPQKNNIQNFYNTGKTFTNSLAFTGGNESVAYRFSLSNMDNQSIVPNSTFNRKIGTLSLNANLSKKLSVETNAQYNIEGAKNRSALSDAPGNPNWGTYMIANTVDVRNLAPGYDQNGNEILWNSSGFATNPYFAVNRFQNHDDKTRFIGYASIKYNLLENLFVKGRVSQDYTNFQYVGIIPSNTAYQPLGGYQKQQSVISETNGELTVGYQTKFMEYVSLSALVGGNQRKSKMEGQNMEGSEFSTPYFYAPDNLKTVKYTNLYQKTATNSVFGSVDLDYQNLIFLTLTGRQDWFSTLSAKNNSIFYPSVGTSFILSDAVQLPSWINYAKLRGSWAQVGGATPQPYALNLTYSLLQGGHLGQPLQQVTQTQVPNSGLKPLTSTTYEVGTEIRFFRNRLRADIAYYDRKTTNDIVQATISPGSGYNTALLNVGEVSNKGVELQLSGTPVKSNGFTWEVGYNVAYNQNRIERLANGLSSIQMDASVNNFGSVYNELGQPYSTIKGWVRKRDVNGQLVYGANGFEQRGDFVNFGTGVSPLTMGLTNTVSYKAFSLNVLVDGKFGGKMYSATNLYATRFGLSKITLPGRESGLTVKGVDLEGNPFEKVIAPENLADYYDNYKNFTELFVYDASFVKLRQVVLTYQIPSQYISFLNMQSASLSFVARNVLILYSQVPNVDPESTFSNSNAQGIEMFGVPRTRSYGFNLQIKF